MNGNLSGPDEPDIQCWGPTGCCLPSACVIDEWDFLCAVRSLLPEGDVFNNTRETAQPPKLLIGVVTVGCARVGCEQLVFGGCCDDSIFCDDAPIAPQLAVVDAFAAAAYGVIKGLCAAQLELDPCTATTTIQRWGERFNLVRDDPCAPAWSDHVISALICAMMQIKGHVMNWDFLYQLALRFGATMVLRPAGDMNCGPTGWWTMARDRNDCPPPASCPPEARPSPLPKIIRMAPACERLPLSLNLILCPSDIILPDNCNLPATEVSPHDPELYEAFLWLLPKILPQPAFYCVYHCDPEKCIQ